MFKLNIECTKDIDELHINFSDGSSSVVTKPSQPKPKPSTDQTKNQNVGTVDTVDTPRRPGALRDQILDLDADFGGVSQEVIKPPEIQREDRPVKVAQELQNFDF